MQAGEAEIAEASTAASAELSDFSIRTYVAAYGADFSTTEELQHRLTTTLSVARWREYLARDHVLEARLDKRLAGYIQFGAAPESSDVEIRRLYVDPEYQGRGLGTALLERALSYPEVVAAPAVWIDVWEENPGARRLYEKFGFVATEHRHPFVLATGEIDGYDIVMVRRQRPNEPE